ncbi:hypothetical protein TNCV_1898451 [Trichonephila clavipes]|uniref:Uncharacterized protein n=1 Tax=Trichonephila clavipes TaxID=2585209 RepID=A0A8X7BJG1_TRICX|nr:hypothetical protein TNCV_1898451 [Trichonephila clavipes]
MRTSISFVVSLTPFVGSETFTYIEHMTGHQWRNEEHLLLLPPQSQVWGPTFTKGKIQNPQRAPGGSQALGPLETYLLPQCGDVRYAIANHRNYDSGSPRGSVSDEAHFWLNGYVNKQNCCIWSEANPQVYVETPLHPEKLTVWCALWAGGILLQKR